MRRLILSLCLLLLLVSAASADYVDRVYWTQFTGSDGVYRANADGSGTEQIVDVTFNSLDGWPSTRSRTSSMSARATICCGAT